MFKMYVGPEALTSYQGAMFHQPTSSARKAAHHHHRMPRHLLPTSIHMHNNRNMVRPKVSHTPHLHTPHHSLLDITRIPMLHLHNKTLTQGRVKVNPLSPHQMSTSLPTLTVVPPAMDMREEMLRPGIQELVTIMSLSTLLLHLVWATLLPPHLRMPV